jgi:hypothetical protein
MDGGTATTTPTVRRVSTSSKILGSGDFDGDGQADVLWRYKDKANSSIVIWRMVGTVVVSETQQRDPGPYWIAAAVADFDANGQADILWANPTNGEHWLWRNGDRTTSQKVSYQNGGANVPTSWIAKGAGDFNRDDTADIFWENSDGNTAIWLMNGSSWIGEVATGARGGGVVFQGIGDFNGDASADVLWRSIDGTLKIWFNGSMTGGVDGMKSKLEGPSWYNQYASIPGTSPAVIRPAPASTAWVIDRIADFNHDGRDDLLWRSGNSMAIWYLDGTRFVGESDPRMPGETSPHWFDTAWQTAGVSRQPNF